MTLIEVISPIDGATIFTGKTATDSEVDAAFAKAEAAFQTWRHSSKEGRAKQVRALADELIRRKNDLSRALTLSTGRPASQADETQRFKAVTETQIEALDALGDDSYPSDVAIRRFTRRNPQGVHLSIAPWNYPIGLLPWLIVTPDPRRKYRNP